MATSEDYRLALAGLPPPGLALSRDPGAVLQRLFGAFAVEGARIDQAAAGMIDEAVPSLASALLPDWERVLGLPDPLDATPAVLLDARRAAAAARLTANAEPTPLNITAALADLGYVVTIEETAQGADCEGRCEGICDTSEWAFGFIVHAPATTVVEMTCLDACESPLSRWGNDALELAVARIKPAHTGAIFRYDS